MKQSSCFSTPSQNAFLILLAAAFLAMSCAVPAQACSATFTSLGVDSAFYLHMTASVSGGDCRGATFTLNGQPWDPFGPNVAWGDGVVVHNDHYNVCGLTPGSYNVVMHADCSTAFEPGRCGQGP